MPTKSAQKKAPKQTATSSPPRRGWQTWLIVLGVGGFSAGAAIVAAGVVIAIMFAVVDMPQPKKHEPLAEQRPIEQPADPKDKPNLKPPDKEKPPIEKPKEKPEPPPPEKPKELPVVAPIVPAEGFVPLFNGKDLTGWQPHTNQPGEWRVENGILTGKSKGGGFLFTTRNDFKDFHLRAEARLKPAGSSGLMFRYDLDYLGYEAMINDRITGVMSVRTRSGPGLTRALFNTGKPTVEPLGEWIPMDIIAEGNRLRVKINGITTTDYTDEKNDFRGGHIGMRDFNGCIEFRRIEIKELPLVAVAPPKLPPGAGAAPFPADAAFTALFNGKDLTNWKVTKHHPGNWRVVNGVLTGFGPTMGELASNRDDYGDFHLRMEVRINDVGQTNVAFRYPFDPDQLEKPRGAGYMTRINGRPDEFIKTGTYMVHEEVGSRNLIAKEQLMTANQWFNFEVIAIGNQVTTRINGRDAVNFMNPKTHLNTGRIVLGFTDFNKAVVVEYRKIEMRTIKAIPLPNAGPPPRPLGEFVPLFNGKDLLSWDNKNKDAWIIAQNGELENKGPAAIVTKRSDYRNFILRLEFTASGDAEGYFAFRQQIEQGKVTGLTSRINGDGAIVRAGGAGIDGDRFESMPFQVKHEPWQPIVLEVHVLHDHLQIKHGKSTVGSLSYPPGRYPPGAIGLHITRGTVRVKKMEISAEPPIEPAPPQIKLRIEDGERK